MRGKLDINRIYLSKDGELKTSSNAISHGWRMLTGKATGQAAIKESIRAFVGSDNGALVDKLMTNFNQALNDRERVGTIPGLPGQKVLKGHEKVGWSERSHAFDALKTTMLSAEAKGAFPGIYQAALEKAPAAGKELVLQLSANVPADKKLTTLKAALQEAERKIGELKKEVPNIDISDGEELAYHFQGDVPTTSYFDQERFSVEGFGADPDPEATFDPKMESLFLQGMADEMKKQIETLEKGVKDAGFTQKFAAPTSEKTKIKNMNDLFNI